MEAFVAQRGTLLMFTDRFYGVFVTRRVSMCLSQFLLSNAWTMHSLFLYQGGEKNQSLKFLDQSNFNLLR